MEGNEGCSLTDRVFRLSTTETEGVIRLIKSQVARADFQRLNDDVENGSSTSMLAQIREVVTWSRIWDQALDWGPKAVDDPRRLFRLLCMPLFADRSCPVCADQIPLSTNYFMHVCQTCDISVDVVDLFITSVEDFQSFLLTSIDLLRTVRRSHVSAVLVD